MQESPRTAHTEQQAEGWAKKQPPHSETCLQTQRTHRNIKNRCEQSRKYRRHGYNPYNFGSAQLSLADRPSGFCGQVKFVFIESAVPTLKMIRSEILHVSADSFRFSFSVPASSVYVGLRQVSLLCFAVYFVSYSPPKCTLLRAYEILRCRFPPVEFKNPHSTVSRVCFFCLFLLTNLYIAL